jgi:hypothetical protein
MLADRVEWAHWYPGLPLGPGQIIVERITREGELSGRLQLALDIPTNRKEQEVGRQI